MAPSSCWRPHGIAFNWRLTMAVVTLVYVCLHLLCGILVSAHMEDFDLDYDEEEDELEDKVSELVFLSSRRKVLRLDSEDFYHFVYDNPRNYSFVVMFTAMSSRLRCIPCQPALHEFERLAVSYRLSEHFRSNKLFFGLVDALESFDIFELLSLRTAPAFVLFPVKGESGKLDRMRVEMEGFQACALGKWVRKRTGIAITIVQPTNYNKVLATVISCATVGCLLYFRKMTALAIITLLFSFTMISGQLWNYIKSPPLQRITKYGNTYVFPQANFQFVYESYIVMAAYGSIVVGMILLTEAVNARRTPYRRKRLVMLGLVLFTSFFFVVVHIFNTKLEGAYQKRNFLIR